MVIDNGYMCKNCKKIYRKSKANLPAYCTKCGEDLVQTRYWYNLTEQLGKIVETKDTNIFGGYDYVKTILSDNVEHVKIKRKFLFWWELFNKQ